MFDYHNKKIDLNILYSDNSRKDIWSKLKMEILSFIINFAVFMP